MTLHDYISKNPDPIEIVVTWNHDRGLYEIDLKQFGNVTISATATELRFVMANLMMAFQRYRSGGGRE